MTAEEIYYCGEDRIKDTELTYDGISYRPVEIPCDASDGDKCKFCHIPSDRCTETPCDLQFGPSYYWVKKVTNERNEDIKA